MPSMCPPHGGRRSCPGPLACSPGRRAGPRIPPPTPEDEHMIAEETQPPARGRESRPGTTPDALRTPALDAPVGTPGRLTAGQAAAGLEGVVMRAAAALKRRMRGWLHAGVFPLALVLAGGAVC